MLTPTADRVDPDANLGYLFRLAHQRFRARLDAELNPLGLTAQQYGILSAFDLQPELSATQLARIAQVTRQTMHATVTHLESVGLLERREANQRVIRLRLSDRGRAALRDATAKVRAVEAQAIVGVSDRDARIIRAWLARLTT